MRRNKGTSVRTKTALKCAGAIVGAVSLFVAITAVTFPRQHLLLSRARRIAPVSLSWSGKFRVSYPCFWLSDQKAMTLQQPTIRRLILPSGLQTHAASINAFTGMYQPMPAFTKAVTTQLPKLIADLSFVQDKTFYIDTPCRVSPDGQWAVFTETTGIRCWGSSLESRNTLININNSHLLHGAWTSGESSILWGADSRSWVEWDGVDKNGANITSHTVAGTSRRQTVSVPAGLSNYSIHPCAMTPENTILAEVEAPDTGSNAEVPSTTPDCKCELVKLPTGDATPASRFTVSLPIVKNVLSRSLTFSPRCDRIAWLVTYRYDLTGFPLLKQLRVRLGDTAHQETAVWVSRLDGTDAHEIGHIAHKPDDSRPQQLAWLPSGKQLSFNYKGDLYTVPAD